MTCNGHGLAQAPYIGTLIADLIVDGERNEDLEVLWAKRPTFPRPMMMGRLGLRMIWAVDRFNDLVNVWTWRDSTMDKCARCQWRDERRLAERAQRRQAGCVVLVALGRAATIGPVSVRTTDRRVPLASRRGPARRGVRRR